MLLNRRSFFQCSAGGLTGLLASAQTSVKAAAPDKGKPTQFQIACMTLPYSAFPLERALSGLQAAGYRYVAWGTAHENVPVMAPDAPPVRQLHGSRSLAITASRTGLGVRSRGVM